MKSKIIFRESVRTLEKVNRIYSSTLTKNGSVSPRSHYFVPYLEIVRRWREFPMDVKYTTSFNNILITGVVGVVERYE